MMEIAIALFALMLILWIVLTVHLVRRAFRRGRISEFKRIARHFEEDERRQLERAPLPVLDVDDKEFLELRTADVLIEAMIAEEIVK